ncbi:MAG: VanZ family protein [Pseudomonadota bacterium]
MKKTIVRIIPTMIYACAIFYLSSRTWNDVSTLPPYMDKVIHFGMYMVFGILVIFSVRLKSWGSLPPQFIISLIIVSLYGVSDEYHQSFVEGRDASFYDWIADAIGGFAGVALGYQISKIKSLFRRRDAV